MKPPAPRNWASASKREFYVHGGTLKDEYAEILKPKAGLNLEVCCRKMDDLTDKFDEKRLTLVNKKHIILQYDNARPHTTLATR